MITDVKILIVDDGSLSNLRVLTGLKSQGFHSIELAVNSNCMFDYLDRGHFDLIISNWSRMEMHGKDFINTVRKHTKHNDIPLIMLTHPTVTMNFQDGLWDEDVRFVNKPISYKVLGETITEVLEKNQTLK